MKKYNVAILGATGAVGQEMMKILAERDFPINKLSLLASSRSVGRTYDFKGQTIVVTEACGSAFDGVDIVLGAAENDISRHFAPAIKASGAVYIDNSSAFRLDPDVPLVVPEINPGDAFRHSGIIANPNCSTIIALMALYPIAAISPIKTIVASTYQAVSGAGIGGMAELEAQLHAIATGGKIETKVFPYQIAENLIPQIGGFNENGYTSEEMKMQNEGRRPLSLYLDHRRDRKACKSPSGRRSHLRCIGSQTVRRSGILCISHASRHQRSGSCICRTHPPRSDKRQRPLPLVLRRSDPQGCGGQCRPDRRAADKITAQIWSLHFKRRAKR